MGLHRLLGIEVGVPDVAALAAFYDELGLVRAATGGHGGTDGGPQVAITDAPFRRLLRVDLGCTADADVDATAARLAGLGLEHVRRAGAVHATDPSTRVEFTVSPAPALVQHPPQAVGANAPGSIVRRNERAPGVFAGPRAPRRLGHIVLGTPDPVATRSFLVDGLGCKVSDEVEGIITFLRCSTDHHNVALVHSPVPMLQHYSWECDDVDHVGHAATSLLRTDASRHAWGFGRHFVGSNFYWYLRDPSGSFLELYSDMDVIDDDVAWDARGRTPVGFEHVANAWGPSIPTEFVVPSDLADLESGWAALER